MTAVVSGIRGSRRSWSVVLASFAAAVLFGTLIPATAATAAPVPLAQAQAQIVTDTNNLRYQAGKASLVRNANLDAVAQAWAQAQANAGAMSHNPNFSSQIPAGWTKAGENVAFGYQPTTVVEAWHQSSGHYANIVGDYSDIGIGYAVASNGSAYYTQTFAKYSAGAKSLSAFVIACYLDVLGREPGPSEIAFHSNLLARGTSFEAVAGGFNFSDEYRLARIGEAYRDVLGRGADGAGQTFWLNLMRRGAIQSDDAHRLFLSSQEFYQAQGGNTDTGWITALYRDILARTPDPDGMTFWKGILANYGRGAVVDGMWLAQETYQKRVNDNYITLLGRGASASEQASWVAVARAYGLTVMRNKIMASGEYQNRATARFGNR